MSSDLDLAFVPVVIIELPLLSGHDGLSNGLCCPCGCESGLRIHNLISRLPIKQ